MGVAGLMEFLFKYAPNAVLEVDSLTRYKGKRAFIDVCIFMYKYAYYHQGEGNEFLDIFVQKYNELKTAYGIDPIFVFDGAPPEAKQKELESRQERRRQADEKKAVAQAGQKRKFDSICQGEKMYFSTEDVKPSATTTTTMTTTMTTAPMGTPTRTITTAGTTKIAFTTTSSPSPSPSNQKQQQQQQQPRQSPTVSQSVPILFSNQSKTFKMGSPTVARWSKDSPDCSSAEDESPLCKRHKSVTLRQTMRILPISLTSPDRVGYSPPPQYLSSCDSSPSLSDSLSSCVSSPPTPSSPTSSYSTTDLDSSASYQPPSLSPSSLSSLQSSFSSVSASAEDQSSDLETLPRYHGDAKPTRHTGDDDDDDFIEDEKDDLFFKCKQQERQQRQPPGENPRRKIRTVSELLEQLDYSFQEQQKVDKMAMKVEKTWYEDLKEIFLKNKIPFVVARGDAEKCAAWMCKHGYGDIVITNDTDAIPDGAPVVLRNVFSSGDKRMQEVHLDRVLKSLRWNIETLVDFCILSGCDFSGTLPEIRGGKAYEKLQYYKTLDRFLKSLEGKAKLREKEREKGKPNSKPFEYEKARYEFLNDEVPLDAAFWHSGQMQQALKPHPTLLGEFQQRGLLEEASVTRPPHR